MTAMRYPHGWDWVWAATDRDGHVAAFVTAGEAPVPRDVIEIQFRDSAHVEEAIAALAPSSGIRGFMEPGDREALVELAHRGLFVYDWRDVRRALRDELGAYELVAAPTTPVRAATLPPVLRVAAMSMRFDRLRFRDAPLIDVHGHAPCLQPRAAATGRPAVGLERHRHRLDQDVYEHTY